MMSTELLETCREL